MQPKSWLLFFVFALAMLSMKNAYGEESRSYPAFGGSFSLQIPHPLNFDFEAQISPYFSVAAGYGFINHKFKSKDDTDVDTALNGFDIRARWHPFGKAFFLGGMLGRQSVSAASTDSVTVSVNGSNVAVPLKASVDVTSLYFTPHIGWLWVYNCGLIMGFELGWQFSFGAKTEISTTSTDASTAALIDQAKQTAEYQTVENRSKEIGDKIGNKGLPYLTLFRIGYLF